MAEESWKPVAETDPPVGKAKAPVARGLSSFKPAAGRGYVAVSMLRMNAMITSRPITAKTIC